MQTADTSKVSVRFKEETTWGVLPTTGKLKELRLTSEDLMVERQTTTSEEIRPDRQIPDLIQTHVEAQGSIKGELSYSSYDEFLEGLMGSTWSTAIDATLTGITIVNGALVIPTAQIPTGLTKGMAVRLGGFTTEAVRANNRVVVILDINTPTGAGTNTTVTVSPALINKSTATNGVTMKGSFIANDQVEKSYTIEKAFTDVDKLLVYRGMVPSTFNMEVEAESKVTVSFNFMGKNGEIVNSTVNPDTTAVFDPAPTNTIMSAGVQDGTIIQGTSVVDFIKAISINVDNNVRGKTAIGTVGNVDIGKGRFNLTGSISTYFQNFTLYENYLNNTGTQLIFTLSSPGSGTYVFYIPNLKFTTGNVVAGGADEDVMADMDYQALLDPAIGKTLVISRLPAA